MVCWIIGKIETKWTGEEMDRQVGRRVDDYVEGSVVMHSKRLKAKLSLCLTN
jgi:hypothetical protein